MCGAGQGRQGNQKERDYWEDPSIHGRIIKMNIRGMGSVVVWTDLF
jgi:hypothetical protein